MFEEEIYTFLNCQLTVNVIVDFWKKYVLIMLSIVRRFSNIAKINQKNVSKNKKCPSLTFNDLNVIFKKKKSFVESLIKKRSKIIFAKDSLLV